MQVLNLEEKNTERMEAINKFTLMDDTFMTQVFSGDLECTEELLKIILKRNDLSVTKSIFTPMMLQGNNMILKSSRMIVVLFPNEPDLTVHYLIQGLPHQEKNTKKCPKYTLSLLHLMMF